MAILRNATGELKVPCRSVVGRSSLADICLQSRRASNEHALLAWSGGRWTLRDLGSSNGTTVDGRPLLTRDRAVVAAGSRVCFGGDEEVWLLSDASPPEPCAVLLGPQHYTWGQQSLLVLGRVAEEDEQPEASVFLEGDQWRLDDGTSVYSPECGDIVRLGSGHWRLLLPDVGSDNAATAGCALDLAQLELSFHTSFGQLTALAISQASNQVVLPGRAYLNTLWELAKLRAGASVRNDGWISIFDLAAQLKCSPEKVNVDIHRLRRLFQESGVHQAARIVERDEAKRMRIGTHRIRLETH